MIKPHRIAVLGGGMSSLAAVWELTSVPDWQDRYQITVYQLGWRCGGKAASGRGPHGRIEEHGIHILQGWYHNTWRLLREAWAERRDGGLAPGMPADLMSALQPVDGTIVAEHHPGHGWSSWPLIYPRNDLEPGAAPPGDPWEQVRSLITLSTELARGVLYAERGAWGDRLHGRLLGRERVEPLLRRLLGDVDGTAAGVRRILAPLGGAARALEAMDPAPASRAGRVVALLGMVHALLSGLLADAVDSRGDLDFSRIEDIDYRAWLARHGASARVLRGGAVRFAYTGTFANLADGGGQGGLIAASTAIRFFLMSATYRGAFVHIMKYGTGDTLVMPFYQVLRARGVRFAFFHEVTALRLSDDGGGIGGVELRRQATPKGGDYDPVQRLDGMAVWPNAPLWDRLEAGDELARREVDLESPWSGWAGVGELRLERGRDFDLLLLGIPIGALPRICRDLCAVAPRWEAMVGGLATVQTPGVQLWLRPDLAELGHDPRAWGLPGPPGQTVHYAPPLYSWIDMSVMLENERWPSDNRPGSVVWLSGALEDAGPLPGPEDHGFPAREQVRVETMTHEWLRHRPGWFWPGGTTPEAPEGLDLALLVDPAGRDLRGIERLRAQLIRPNADPSSRYTLTLPGTAHLRMKVDESGFKGLFLCGDWTDFGLNVGYVEGAVISGMQAAGAIVRELGLPRERPIW